MKIFDRFVLLFSKHWFNPFFTLWFNFRFLPFKQAIHLPILVWGMPKIISLNPNFEIILNYKKIKRGLVKINQTGEYPSHSGGHTEFVLCGKSIIFKGTAFIGCGTRIVSYLNSTIIIGNHVVISQQNTIVSCEKLILEDCVRIGSKVQIMDSSMHFVYHSDERKVKKLSSPVIIGHNTWIANGASVYKGTILPPYIGWRKYGKSRLLTRRRRYLFCRESCETQNQEFLSYPKIIRRNETLYLFFRARCGYILLRERAFIRHF